MIITREQYMNHKATHREYYGQFVNDNIKQVVARRIGLKRILNSQDEHFNDIPLQEWDNVSPVANVSTLGEGVCIVKEAAKQLQEDNNVNT